MKEEKITIEKAVEGDAAAIRRVQKVCWLATYQNKDAGIDKETILTMDFESQFKIDRMKEKINETDKQILVAKAKNEVIGFAVAGQKENKLEALYIVPEFQGLGIGKRLMRMTFDFLNIKKRITLGVDANNLRAIEFYKRLGFQLGNDIEHETPTFPNGVDMPEKEMFLCP